jgi:hypothetical protein
MTADLVPAPDNRVSCCDLDPREAVSTMWFESLPPERRRDVVRRHGRTLPFMVGPPHHLESHDKYRPGAVVAVEVSAGYPEALHGTGMRLVIMGCNQRLRRPRAWVMCTECGRAAALGRPPRGWPTRAPRARHVRFYERAGWRLGAQVGATTIMRGVSVRATERIEAR